MSIDALLTETVTVVNYTGTTRGAYNAVEAATPVETATVGRLEQLSTEEIIRDQDTVLADWQVFLPAGTPVAAQSKIQGRGHTFDVYGLPDELRTPRGPHHVVVRLRLVI